MRVLVTGGAGFIGSAIVPVLLEAGHEVAIIDNLSFGKREFVKIPDTLFYVLDIRDKTGMEQAVSRYQPEMVIHLAAIHFIPYCNMHPFEASDINIRGTINILDVCKKCSSLKKILFASTAAVYPVSDTAVNELFPLEPLDIYGLSKLTGEKLFKLFHLETGLDTIICRFFNAFGPNETNPHLIPEIERQVGQGFRKIRLGNLNPKRDFIHTRDMANAVKKLIELNDIGFETFNLGRGLEYSVKEVVHAFERQLGDEITVEVDPDRVRKVERMHLLADVAKIKSATGWEPEWSLDEGIEDLLKSTGIISA